MLRRLLTALLLFVAINSQASHIVGGEFELLFISGNTYRLNLILYFDVNNGNPGALDQNVIASIFRKRADSLLLNIPLPLILIERVDYYQPECSTGEVVTDRLTYTAIITLSDEQFNDQEGYYISWERCCRNYTITNIYSQDPQVGSLYAGQTFYLEFPAVVDENGDPFINSSPQLFPPLNDYACPNRPYWVDFAGTDVDGDSLVYTLVNPLSTHVGQAFPNNPGAPYPTITWKPGFGLNNIIGGDPDLAISDDGFLTVTPKDEGLFVFAVRCDEYRDGIKIGELRRDFQMLVVDKCPQASPPVVSGKKLGDSGFPYNGDMTITFSNTTSDANRCIQIRVSDIDSTLPEDNFEEKIDIAAIALNFEGDLSTILPDQIEAILVNGSTEIFEICFPECPFIDPEITDNFEIAIVAYDDACALPLSDSLHITVFIEPPVNTAPYFADAKGGGKLDVLVIDVIPDDGKIVNKTIQGFDDDNQVMIMDVIPVGNFDPSLAGISFSEPNTSTNGQAITNLTWNIDCNDESLDYSEGRVLSQPDEEVVKAYDFLIIIEDEDDCNWERLDTLETTLIIRFKDEYIPNVYETTNGPAINYLNLSYSYSDEINLNIKALDGQTDNDNLILYAEAMNFNMATFGASFSRDASEIGPGTEPGTTGIFNWPIDCNTLHMAEIDSFRVNFYTQDIDNCNAANRDTLAIDFIISEPINTKPQISFQSQNGNQVLDNEITINYLQEIEVDVIGLDFNFDSLRLELLNVSGSQKAEGFEFVDVEGVTSVRSTLTWDADCRFLANDYSPGEYVFTFILTDNSCPKFDADTLALKVNIEDLVLPENNFNPPNVFTPNGDDFNPYFAVEGIDESTQTTIDRGLPIDNCKSQFESIRIYNRWGKEVFQSNIRDFKWYGDGEAPGAYYYYIEYTDTEYRGTVTILY